MSPTAAAQMALSRDEDSFTELPSNDIFVQKNCKTGKINGVVGTEILLNIFLLQKGYRLVICECFGTVKQCFEFFFLQFDVARYSILCCLRLLPS